MRSSHGMECWPQRRLSTIADPVDRGADASRESIIREDCGHSGHNDFRVLSGLTVILPGRLELEIGVCSRFAGELSKWRFQTIFNVKLP